MPEFELGPTGLRPDELREWSATMPSAVVFEHPYHHTIVQETVARPDGSEAVWIRHADEREGLDVRDAVGAICVRDDGRVLVSWQWNLGPRRVVAEFPGGGVHDGESYEDAVRREVAEEVHLWPRRVELLGRVLYDNRRSPWLFRWYLATDLADRRLDGDEAEIATAWLTADEVDAQIAAGAFDSQSMLAAWSLYTACRRRSSDAADEQAVDL